MNKFATYQNLMEYATLKFYRVENKDSRVASGILLNYSPTSVVLLLESGLLHIPTNEIIEMYPYTPDKKTFNNEDYLAFLYELGIIKEDE